MFKNKLKVLLVLVLVSILAVACGGKSGAPVSNGGAKPAASVSKVKPRATAAPANQIKPTLPTVSNTDTPGPGEAAGVETALVTYSDLSQKFAIGHSASWTRDSSVKKGVKFVSGDVSMKLEIVTPHAGMKAMAYAQSDAPAVSAAFPGFKQLSLAASTEVQNAIILGFTANGKSLASGKTFTAQIDRYYMQLANGRIAVLTVVSPSNNYDQQVARDIAMTFKATK